MVVLPVETLEVKQKVSRRRDIVKHQLTCVFVDSLATESSELLVHVKLVDQHIQHYLALDHTQLALGDADDRHAPC